jgi:acetyl-CoA decarbonylase/synthase complex subunit gamma
LGGKGVRKATTGGETVQYRHEKTFYNPTLLAAQVGSDIAAADLEAKLKGGTLFSSSGSA